MPCMGLTFLFAPTLRSKLTLTMYTHNTLLSVSKYDGILKWELEAGLSYNGYGLGNGASGS